MSEVPPPPPQHEQPGFSNYPRAGGGYSTDPYTRPAGVYFDSIGQAWRMVQANFGTWVPSVLVAGIIAYAVTVPINFGGNYLIYGSVFGSRTFSFTSLIVSVLLGLLQGCITNVMAAGMLFMGVKQARNEQIGVGDIFCGFRRFGSIIIASLLTTIFIELGFCLLLLPGIFLAGAFAFVPLLIVDRDMQPWEAIVASYEALKAHAWAMFALVFVAGLASALGVCACGVGALFTAPIYMVTIGLTYNTFFPPAYAQFGYQPIGIEPPR